MEKMKLATELFGVLEVEIDDGFSGTFELTVEKRKMIPFLFIHEETIGDDNAGAITAFLNQIPALYKEAKRVVLAKIDDSELIRYFVDEELENIDELHEIFNVATNADITDDMFIKQLELSGVGVLLNENGELNYHLDLTISKEHTDELLVVYFDTALEILTITHES